MIGIQKGRLTGWQHADRQIVRQQAHRQKDWQRGRQMDRKKSI